MSVRHSPAFALPGGRFHGEMLWSQVLKKKDRTASLKRRKTFSTEKKIGGKAQKHVHGMIKKWFWVPVCANTGTW